MRRLISDKELKRKLRDYSDQALWRLRRDGKLPKPKKFRRRNVTPEDQADEGIAGLVGR